MTLHFQDKEIKINKLLIIMIAVLFITIILLIISPKNQKITCTKKENLDSATLTEVYTGIFKKGKLNTLIVEFENKPTNNYLNMIDAIYDNYSKQLTELKNDGGYDFTIEKENNLVKFKSTIDVNKIPDETKNKVGFNGEWEYENFKQNLEKSGFTCK